jgi:hypothetical protein
MFNVSIVLIVVGILIVFTGGVLAILGNVTSGLVGAASGLFSDAVGAMLLWLYRDVNDRLDTLIEPLITLETTRAAVESLAKIEDSEKRDAAITDMVGALKVQSAAMQNSNASHARPGARASA